MKKLMYLILAFSCASLANYDVGRLPSPYNGGAVDLEPGPNQTVWGATWGNGVIRSVDNAETFTEVGNDIGNKHVNQVKYNEGTLLAVTYSGIYKSSNDGDSWEDINNGIDLTTPLTSVDFKGSNTFFVGSQGDGMYRSVDAGDNWEQINNGLDFRDILFVFVTTSGHVLASTKGDGVYRSTNNGDTWQRENSGMYSNYATHIEEDPTGTIWASTAGEGLFQTDQDATFWSPYFEDGLTDRNILSFALYEDDGKYFPYISTRKYGVMWFNNSGFVEAFERTSPFQSGVEDIIQMGNNEFSYTASENGIRLLIDYNDDPKRFSFNSDYFYNSGVTTKIGSNGVNIYTGNGEGLFKSTDGGKTFVITDFQEPVREFKVDGSNIVVVPEDKKSVWSSSNEGDNFTEIQLDLTAYPDIANADKSPYFENVDIDGNNIIAFLDLKYTWISMADPPDDFEPNLTRQLAEATSQNLNWTVNDINDSEGEVITNLSWDLDLVSNGDIYITFLYDSLYLRRTGSSDWDKVEADFPERQRQNIIEPLSNLSVLYGAKDSLLTYTKNSNLFRGIDLDVSDREEFEDIYSLGVFNSTQFYIGCNAPIGLLFTRNQGVDVMDLSDQFPVCDIRSLAVNENNEAYFGKSIVYRYIDPEYLDPPELLSLDDKTTNVAIDINDSEGLVKPIFEWGVETRADMYNIEISKSELFSGDVDNLVFDENSHTITQILEGSTLYYWRVRTRANDVYSDWSPVRTFTTELATPELEYPIEDQVGVALNASMSWSAVDLATSYDVQIAEDETLQNLVFDASEVTSTTVTADNVENYTNYVWRVRANNGSSKGKWSEFETFITIPDMPVLVYPENGSGGIPTAIDFKFEKAEGGEIYYIQLSTDENLSDPSIFLLDRETDTDSTHFFDFLSFNRNYYWRMRTEVRGVDDDDEEKYSGEFTDIFAFSTGASAPGLQLPNDMSVDLDPATVELSWDNVNDAENYEVQVSTDAAFGDFILQETQAERTYQLNDLEGYTVYYWRVRAFVDGTAGIWSDVWEFRTWIKSPIQSFPDCGANGIDPNVPRIVWELPNGATRFEAELSESSIFENPIQSITDINSDRVDFDPLEADRQYYWRVRGYNEESTGQWTEPCSFTTSANSVKEILNTNLLELFPNPAKENFSLRIDAVKGSELSINIYSMNGNFRGTIFNGFIEQGANLLDFKTNELISGKYLLEINTDRGSITKDLIIQK